NRIVGKEETGVAQTRFLFPKCALDLRKKLATTDFPHVHPGRRAGIGIHCRAVSDDEKRVFRAVRGLHDESNIRTRALMPSGASRRKQVRRSGFDSATQPPIQARLESSIKPNAEFY